MKKDCILYMEPKPSILSKETSMAPSFQGPSLPGGEEGNPMAVQEF